MKSSPNHTHESSRVEKPIFITPDTTDLQVEEVQAQLAAIHQYLHQIGIPYPNVTEEESDSYMYVKSKGKRQKIYFADITWIKSERNYVSIFTERGQIVTMMPISTLEQQIPVHSFMRVHKSFIVALHKVDYVLKDAIGVKRNLNVKTIPLGARFKKNFLQVVEQKMAKKNGIVC